MSTNSKKNSFWEILEKNAINAHIQVFKKQKMFFESVLIYSGRRLYQYNEDDFYLGRDFSTFFFKLQVSKISRRIFFNRQLCFFPPCLCVSMLLNSLIYFKIEIESRRHCIDKIANCN